MTLDLSLAAVVCFWVTIAGLITGIPALRTFGAVGVILFLLAAWLVDRYTVERVERERDWQWPPRQDRAS